MKQSSITDWLQVVAVFTALGLGIWEFVIKDRDSQLKQIEFTNSMILKSSSNEFLKGIIAINNMSSKNVSSLTELKRKEFELEVLPVEMYYDSWGFCYEHELCSREVTLDLICVDLVSITALLKAVRKGGPKEYSVDKDIKVLLGDCIKYQKVFLKEGVAEKLLKENQ